jgi:alpha-mannosidase
LSARSGGITLEGTGLVFSALKPTQGGRGNEMALRCYNPCAARAAGAWRFAHPVNAAFRTRLDEQGPVPLVLEDGGRLVRFAAEPHEIVTVVVRGR